MQTTQVKTVERTVSSHPCDMDGYRLMGLARIPRCAACPRYRALAGAHESRERLQGPLPPAPAGCTHEVCAPLVRRFRISAA